MQTNIDKAIKTTTEGVEAERILRSCVHCGFCTATCPTYRLLGDELDGPRGRIYLIKGLLEGSEASDKTQIHLDRCLTCLACETSCPSGVEYGHLLDIGRQLINKKVRRTPIQRVYRYLIRNILPYPGRFSFFLRLGRGVRIILPGKYRQMVPENKRIRKTESASYQRKMILFSGCVQPLLSPEINCATTNLLDKLGIETISSHGEVCCGAINHHMAVDDSGLSFIKNNIDAWWPYIEEGIEAIVISASGCGAMIKDYGYILRNDIDYKDKARQVSMMAKDVGEIIVSEKIEKLRKIIKVSTKSYAFQNPCSLQHGQKIKDDTEVLLKKLGYQIDDIEDANQCCGSAGTYSLLQTELSEKLRRKKISAMEAVKPDVILTANIGCQLHLQQATEIPVKHWIEILEEDIQS
ncbi:MAG: glycolate oxidase iron-sulfur subunit [Gammaproteobacteria bacterium]|nr:MAG: glycolate oxidase iron-sulfur subunit [Gammaproteobacteria bacterium]